MAKGLLIFLITLVLIFSAILYSKRVQHHTSQVTFPEPAVSVSTNQDPNATERRPVGPNSLPSSTSEVNVAEVNVPEVNMPPKDSPESQTPNEPNSAEMPATIPVPPEANQSQPEPNTTRRGGLSESFNHKFADIFGQYVRPDGSVDYQSLRQERLQLKALLLELAMLDDDVYKAWPQKEKMAFWLNVYNLKMLDIMVDNYPIESKRIPRLWWDPTSIRHIPPIGEVGSVKWNRYKFIVMDEQFTLYEVEKRFFRKQFKDPRLFLGLCLATKDSPPLRNEPYYGLLLDQQLEDQAKRFISSPRGVQIDRTKERVYLSAIFEAESPWYGKEFEAKYETDKKFKSQPAPVRAVLNFICNYLPASDVSYLETGNYSVTFRSFDWRLNQ